MKGLTNCFSYHIDYHDTDETHSCSALNHNESTGKPFCCGSIRPLHCSFYKTREQYKVDAAMADKRNIKGR